MSDVQIVCKHFDPGLNADYGGSLVFFVQGMNPSGIDGFCPYDDVVRPSAHMMVIPRVALVDRKIVHGIAHCADCASGGKVAAIPDCPACAAAIRHNDPAALADLRAHRIDVQPPPHQPIVYSTCGCTTCDCCAEALDILFRQHAEVMRPGENHSALSVKGTAGVDIPTPPTPPAPAPPLLPEPRFEARS